MLKGAFSPMVWIRSRYLLRRIANRVVLRFGQESASGLRISLDDRPDDGRSICFPHVVIFFHLNGYPCLPVLIIRSAQRVNPYRDRDRFDRVLIVLPGCGTCTIAYKEAHKMGVKICVGSVKVL